MKLFTLLSFWLISVNVMLFAQNNTQNGKLGQIDTLTLSYTEAKKIFLRDNLMLLSKYYDISLAEADLVQSKLWRNPYFVWNQDMYSVNRNEYFNYKLQTLIQIEQVFSISGKHVNGVRLAKAGIKQTKAQLQEVLRGLLYELGTNYMELYTLQKKQNLYKITLEKYKTLIESAENKLRVGAISKNEVLRLKSEELAIKSEALKNRNEVVEDMSKLRQLLNFKENVHIITQPKNDVVVVEPTIAELLQMAQNRPDMELAVANLEYARTNLRLQRSNAVPDIKLGYQPVDRGSNYVRPYTGMVFEMSIPVFDRNQGNIKSAKAKIDQVSVQQLAIDNQIRNEIAEAFAKLVNTKEALSQFSPQFLEDIENLNKNSQTNYDRKNINLLEYIDLQRIYLQNQLQYIDFQNEYQKSINQLNFSVGKEIIE
jgi:outer membrane protein, heavy metal efflux system